MKTITLAALFFAACNPNDAGPGISTASLYVGPSVWTAQVNPDSTTTLLHFPALGDTQADFLANTEAVTGSGITSLTVTASAGDAPLPDGTVLSAVEAPGALYTFLIDGAAPVLVARACSGLPVAASFVTLHGNGAVAGTFSYDPSSGIANEAARTDALGTSLGASSLGVGTCDDGTATLSSAAQLYLSTDGVTIVHEQPELAPDGDSIAIALPTPADPVSLEAFSASFVGTFHDGAAAAVVNVSNGVITRAGTEVGRLALTTLGPAHGTATGTITIDGSAHPARCAIATTSHTIVACNASLTTGTLATLQLVAQ